MAEVEAEPGLADAAGAVATIGGGVAEPAVAAVPEGAALPASPLGRNYVLHKTHFFVQSFLMAKLSKTLIFLKIISFYKKIMHILKGKNM